MPPPIEEEWPAVLLVRPQMGENIGAVARVLLNFGLISLRLVSPRDRWPNPKAEVVAVGADKVLKGARVEWSIEDALADAEQLVELFTGPGLFKKAAGVLEKMVELSDGAWEHVKALAHARADPSARVEIEYPFLCKRFSISRDTIRSSSTSKIFVI